MFAVLLDMVYPRQCEGCGHPDPAATPHLCWECFASLLPVAAPFCEQCGDPVSGSIDHAYTCAACHATPPAFDQARSGVHYDGLARDLVLAFKYRRALWLAQDLGCLLLAAALSFLERREVDMIVPVPLYHARRRERGFNQASLLAGCLARAMDKPLLGGCLYRKRPTSTQTRLTAAARTANVNTAFGVRRPVRLRDRRLLLVDDVMTTGATINACARVLKRGGAARVWGVTVARG